MNNVHYEIHGQQKEHMYYTCKLLNMMIKWTPLKSAHT